MALLSYSKLEMIFAAIKEYRLKESALPGSTGEQQTSPKVVDEPSQSEDPE